MAKFYKVQPITDPDYERINGDSFKFLRSAAPVGRSVCTCWWLSGADRPAEGGRRNSMVHARARF
jgi:hypothetical protein